MATTRVGIGRLVAVLMFFSLGFAWPKGATAQVAAKKQQEGGLLGGKWYGSLEFRHHANTYYDQDGYFARQEPSAQARIQLGAQFYEGLIDAYTTLGVFKIPETQQIMQRQPEFAFDIYPYRGQYFTLLQYNMLQMPVKEQATTPVTEDEKTFETQSSRGTVYTIGLAPTLKVPMAVGSSRIDVKGGFDAWTRLYSRRQYTDEIMYEDDEGRLALVENADEEPIEDYAMHYRNQIMGGAAIEPGFISGLMAEVTAHHNSRFDPRYIRDDDGNLSYEYSAVRYSFYRWRMRYELTDRISLTNDFYHFFDGAFQGQRESDERRFRNVARLTCKL